MTAQTTTLPSDWIITDPSTWTLSTTIDAHGGYHSTGMVMREFQEIRHSAVDHGAKDDLGYDEESGEWYAVRHVVSGPSAYERDPNPNAMQDAAEWWFGVLDPIHRAEIAIGEASPEEIGAAADKLGIDPSPDGFRDLWNTPHDDLEQQAAHADDILAALNR